MNGVRSVGVTAKIVVKPTQAQEAQRRDAESHNRPAVKGDVERRGCTLLVCSNRGSHIGFRCGVHPEVAGGRRGHRTRDEGDGSIGAQRRHQNANDQHRGKSQQHLVLTVHKHHGAQVDLLSDTTHLVFARIGA